MPDEHEISLMQQFMQMIGQILNTVDEAKRNELWDKLASIYIVILERKGSFFANMALLDWLSKQYQDQLKTSKDNPRHVLDLGSGPSTLFRAYERVKDELSTRGVYLDISEIDASPEMLAKGVPRKGRQYLGSFENIGKLPENTYDLVNLSFAYSYVTHPALFMTNVHRVLKKNGLAAFIFPEASKVPEAFTDAMTKLGFEVIVGEGGTLQSKLDDKTYTQLAIEYGKEYADDLAKLANGNFTLLLARKQEAVNIYAGEVTDDQLRLIRVSSVSRGKLKRTANLFKDKLEGLNLLAHGGKIEGDVTISPETGLGETQPRKAGRFVENVSKHLSNLVCIIHSDVDKKSASAKDKRRNYLQVQKGLTRLLDRITELKDSQDLNKDELTILAVKINNFRNDQEDNKDKKIGQWFKDKTDLSEIIQRIKGVLGDQAMLEFNQEHNQPVSNLNSRNTGGIDLTQVNRSLESQNPEGEIKFHIDPAMMEQLRNAPGFVPVIISMKPMKDLKRFLGIVSPNLLS